jgi:hypothetical protein
MQNTKFFRVDDGTYLPCLYVCHKDTPIPTAKEITERNNLAPHTAHDIVTEISMEDFLHLHNLLLTEIADSANDMIEWSPNAGAICSWEWWYSAEEWEEMQG